MKHEIALSSTANTTQLSPVVSPFTGTWKNELGSTVTIQQTGNVLSGTYTSTVSGGSGSVSGTLIGYANGPLVSFTVNWSGLHSITTWAGQLEILSDAQEVIDTLWYMTSMQAHPGNINDFWNTINAGADKFSRV